MKSEGIKKKKEFCTKILPLIKNKINIASVLAQNLPLNPNYRAEETQLSNHHIVSQAIQRTNLRTSC